MKKVRLLAVLVVVVLSACEGGRSTPDVGDVSVPTAVPTSVPTPTPTATAVPNILEVVRAQAEVRARIEAEVEAEGEVRMTAEQFQAWQAEQNRHAEVVLKEGTDPLRDVAVAFAAAEAADDVSRNWGGAIAIGMAIGCVVFLLWLMKTGGSSGGETGGD